MKGVKNRNVSLWRRLLAYLIDILLLNFVVIFPFAPVLKSFKDKNAILTGFNLDIFLALLSVSVLSYVYFVYLDYKLRKTLGKIILRFKTNGKNLTLGRLLVRNITKPFLILYALDILYMLYKGIDQRYTEIISNTWVENG